MLTMRMTLVLIPSDTVARCRERRETLALGASALTPTGRQQRLPPHRYCAPRVVEKIGHIWLMGKQHTLYPVQKYFFIVSLKGLLKPSCRSQKIDTSWGVLS